MTTSFVVSAPGKLHLLGEHSVVYKKPALLAAIDKRCFVKVSLRKDASIVCIAKDLSKQRVFTKKEIIDKTLHARNMWEVFQKNPEKSLVKHIIPTPMDFVVIAIGESLLALNKELPSGFTLKVYSEIPMGSGMGSSAACAVAIAGGMSFLFAKKLDKKMITNASLRIEQRVHGNPSGADTAVSIAGGIALFTKNKPIQRLSLLPKAIQDKFSVIFTGKPEETTGEMVTKVKKKKEKSKKDIDAIFNNQEKLVIRLVDAMQESNEKKIVEIMTQGEKNLEVLGVVSKSTKKLIRAIEKLGGAAKICGAGGQKNASGVVLVFGVPHDVLKHKLQIPVGAVILGTKGVVKEV